MVGGVGRPSSSASAFDAILSPGDHSSPQDAYGGERPGPKPEAQSCAVSRLGAQTCVDYQVSPVPRETV